MSVFGADLGFWLLSVLIAVAAVRINDAHCAWLQAIAKAVAGASAIVHRPDLRLRRSAGLADGAGQRVRG